MECRRSTDALNARLATAQAVLMANSPTPPTSLTATTCSTTTGSSTRTRADAAVDDLIKRKPDLAARRLTGNLGQGAHAQSPGDETRHDARARRLNPGSCLQARVAVDTRGQAAEPTGPCGLARKDYCCSRTEHRGYRFRSRTRGWAGCTRAY